MVEKQVKIEKTDSGSNIVAGIDINKLVKKAQESYGKKGAGLGLAKQLSTGRTINRPIEDKDFILWTKNDLWQKLTGGLKGIPWGKFVQFSGKFDAGKSTISLEFMSMAQKQGHLVILFDSEKKFNADRYDNRIGGDSNNLLVVNTNNIIDGATAVAQFVHAAKELNPKCKVLICWDSVGASLSSVEDKDDSEDFSAQPGNTARESGWAIKKFAKLMNKYMDKETGEESIAVILVNQTYSTIGGGMSVQQEKGGGTIAYLSSLIIQMSRKQDLTRVKNGEKYKYGIVSRLKVKKNHLFDATESLAELDAVISASGVQLASDVKNVSDIQGWDNSEEDE